MGEIIINSIGIVKNRYIDPKDLIFACEKGLNTLSESEIAINSEFIEGLKCLEEFSHIFVLYYLDKAERIELITHPGPPKLELPKVGVFASRSQYRPNHIALRLAKIIKIENGSVFVKGLDAINGTRVIDIKPYVEGFDRPKEFKGAQWYDWLNK